MEGNSRNGILQSAHAVVVLKWRQCNNKLGSTFSFGHHHFNTEHDRIMVLLLNALSGLDLKNWPVKVNTFAHNIDSVGQEFIHYHTFH